MTIAPLDDPAYQPKHPPINGQVPDVVAKWGPRSQLRWFDRYRGQLAAQPVTYWARFHTSSLLHRGECCPSCMQDQLEGYDEWCEDRCCCRAVRLPATPPG